MNWEKLSKDYPLAYKLMEKKYKCLFTLKYEVNSIPSGMTKTIKHPLKRDLYDFFDNRQLIVEITHIGVKCDNPFGWSVDIELSAGVGGSTKTRSQAETEAFTKAFEILNKRLENVQECQRLIDEVGGDYLRL